MGLFRRQPKPFWLQLPFNSADPSLLYQGGIDAVGRSDGPAMTSIGWRLWELAGLHAYQAFDLITDGFKLWSESPAFNAQEAFDFLHEMLGRLHANPMIPLNIYQAPRELVEPAAAHYGARAWVAAELWSFKDWPGCPSEDDLCTAIATCPAPFVPARSMSRARSHAASRGWPDPFA